MKPPDGTADTPAIERMTGDERAIVVKWFARVLLEDALRELAEEGGADRASAADTSRRAEP